MIGVEKEVQAGKNREVYEAEKSQKEWGTPFRWIGERLQDERGGDGAGGRGEGVGGSQNDAAETGVAGGEKPGGGGRGEGESVATVESDRRVEEVVLEILRNNPELLPDVIRAADDVEGEYAGGVGGLGAAAAEAPLLVMLADVREESRKAREMGEMFLKHVVDAKVREFFSKKSGGETAEGLMDEFYKEAMKEIGKPEAGVLEKLPGVLEKVFRVVNYPRIEARERREGERYRVEGGGSGSMNVLRNRPGEEDFRTLTERLKREMAGW